jgi:hypothetical protein
MCYHDPPRVKADSAKDGDIPSVQIIYEPSQVWSHHVVPLVLDKFSVELVDTSIDSSMFATISTHHIKKVPRPTRSVILLYAHI